MALKDELKRFSENIAKIFSSETTNTELAADAPAQDSEKKYSSDELKISDAVVGGTVQMVQEDGSLAPAPDGEYLYEDGNEYTVKDGVITDIVKDSPEEDAKEKENMSAEVPAQEETPSEIDLLKSQIEEYKQQLEEYKKATDELKESFAAIKSAMDEQKVNEEKFTAQFSKQVDDLNNTLKTLAELPAEPSKTSQSNIVKDSYFQKTSELSLWGKKK